MNLLLRRFAFKRGEAVPRFHYETRAFSKVVSNTDLTDNDLGRRHTSSASWCRFILIKVLSSEF
jgi:hypothetical protein